jgi:Acetyltransferases
MENGLTIEHAASIEKYAEELADLLIAVVNDGASIGFLPPMGRAEAKSYWEGVLAPDVRLYVATLEGRITGTVQVHFCSKANGRHRAEIAKLMTHPGYRRRGIGRALMREAEVRVREFGIRLLVLDTRDGDPSNLLYASLGYVLAGSIPGYALSSNGQLDPTNLYYKV